MRRQLLPALRMTIAMTVLCGLIYPGVVWAVSQATMSHKADGSFVSQSGKVVGSSLIGQSFAGARYFHPRPSAAGDGYDALASSGSSLGPTSQKLLDAVAQRVQAYRAENDLPQSQPVPVDAVTASGSGLDPQISVANARLQAPRVARERQITLAAVMAAINRHTQHRMLGVLGEDGVNVLALNLDLDRHQ